MPAARRSNPRTAKTMGEPDTKSGNKAQAAADRADQEIRRQEREPSDSSESWPVGNNGTPMMKAEMSAAELIPTGQFANVSVGPARLHFLIDPDRQLKDGETYFSEQQRVTLAKALNEVAEIIEGDVVAVQRNLVLESIQDQVSSAANGSNN